jgi:hypothetical protein
MDEKIEEMAKCICPSYERKMDCETCPTEWCYAKECATMAFCNGYRKESDTAREILTELKNTRFHKGTLTYDFEVAVNRLAEKYGVDLGE